MDIPLVTPLQLRELSISVNVQDLFSFEITSEVFGEVENTQKRVDEDC